MAEATAPLAGLEEVKRLGLPTLQDFPGADGIYGEENLDGLKHERLIELRTLQALAWPHVKASGGRMALLAVNPDLYPYQSRYRHSSTKVINDPGLIGSLANAASGNQFTLIENGLFPKGDERAAEWLDDAAEILKGRTEASRGNVLTVTPHGELTDIALDEAAKVKRLIEVYGQDFLDGVRRAIIVSRIVSVIGVDFGNATDKPFHERTFLPAVEALEFLCDEIFLSFPKTDTVTSRFHKSLIKVHNRHMLSQLFDLLKSGGVVLGMAASGTKDKEVTLADLERMGMKMPTLPARPEDGRDSNGARRMKVIRMAPLGERTLDIMMEPKSSVWPDVLWMRDGTVKARMLDKPRKMLGREQSLDVYRKIAQALTVMVPDHVFVFDDRPDVK